MPVPTTCSTHKRKCAENVYSVLSGDQYILKAKWFQPDVKKDIQTRVLLCKRKEIVFAQQKQSVKMSINDFAEMTNLVCLICFPFIQKINLPAKTCRKMIF